MNSSIIVGCCYTYSGLVWHSDIAEAFAASSRVCRSSQLQKTLILHGLDVRSSCVPWSNFDLVVHLQLHFLVISILLRSEEEFFSVTSILVNLQPSVSSATIIEFAYFQPLLGSNHAQVSATLLR